MPGRLSLTLGPRPSAQSTSAYMTFVGGGSRGEPRLNDRVSSTHQSQGVDGFLDTLLILRVDRPGGAL